MTLVILSSGIPDYGECPQTTLAENISKSGPRLSRARTAFPCLLDNPATYQLRGSSCRLNMLCASAQPPLAGTIRRG